MVRRGAWVRTGGLLGLVVETTDDDVAVLNPGDRQLARVPPDEVEEVPAGSVQITASVVLPVPHGLEESSLRRWLAALIDPVLREAAADRTREAGLDDAAFTPEPRLEAVRPASSGAVCLAGHRVPAADGTTVECPACGRAAVARPTPDAR